MSGDQLDWEDEVRMQRWLRDNSLTPYAESRRWRHRFLWALFLDLVLSILVLILASNR